MVYGAIDLHKRMSQIRIVDETGALLCERRIATERGRLVAVFAPYGAVRVLLESGTESEWVAQALEQAGYEVIVADPNFAPMYGELRRKVKTDRRDAAALAEANRRGWYRPAYRASLAQRRLRQVLRGRRQLVQQRSGLISLMRAILRQEGCALGAIASERLAARIAALALPPAVAATLQPLRRVVTTLTREVARIDARLARETAGDPVIPRLRTVPGVGPVVALTFRAFVDRVDRFASAGQVSAALGLVPREDSSAERQHRGHISKAGPRELRSLFVQAAWACWHCRTRASGPLRAWTDRLAARRGKRIAVVALARRLSRIAYAVWRDETTFRCAAT
jgi:transposase